MNDNFYLPENTLVTQICGGDLTLLPSLFNQRTSRLKAPMLHCEGYTLEIFNDLTQNISNDAAFSLIPETIVIVDKQDDQQLFLLALTLLVGLIQASNTTQLEPLLFAKLASLSEKAKMFINSQEADKCLHPIYQWYRIKNS